MSVKLPKATILCVDDSKDILFLHRQLLEKNGYRVLTATSGQDGLNRLSQGTIDAAIIDNEMPGMSGIHLACEIKRTSGDTPVLMFSASPPPDTLVAIDLFLSKKLGHRVLIEGLRLLLARSGKQPAPPPLDARSASGTVQNVLSAAR